MIGLAFGVQIGDSRGMSYGEQIARQLNRAGIPVKQGFCGPHGRGVFTFHGRESAERAADLLGRAFVVAGPRECLDDAAQNRGTIANPTTVRVWRVWLKGPRDGN